MLPVSIPPFHRRSNSLGARSDLDHIESLQVDYLGCAEGHGHKERTILNNISTEKKKTWDS